MTRPPEGVKSETARIKTGCGFLYVTTSQDPAYAEVFFKLGKTGGCAAAMLQALAITASLALRAGVPLDKIINNWKGIGCPSGCWDGGEQVLSCPDGIAKILVKQESRQILT